MAYLRAIPAVGMLLLILAICFQAQQIKAVKAQLRTATDILDRLHNETKAKQKETARRVEVGKVAMNRVDRDAKAIEAAPIAPGCATPALVMGADL